MISGRHRMAVSLMLIGAVMFALSGCADWRGLNTFPLPGTQGKGPGSYVVQAQMPDVNNLQQNSRVRVADVSVGNVTKIERQGWNALVTMRLNGDVALPANATAKLGQTSLLGSQHIELAPPVDAPPQGRLHDGSLIPLAHSGSYPTTEQTLATLSMVLNGGGIGKIGDITEAFSTAFRGREKDVRSLIVQLDRFTAYLNDQSGDIIAATESLNRLAGQVAEQQPVVDRALKTIPDALAELNKQRENLVEAADKLGQFSALITDTVNQSKEDVVKILRDIGPVLESLANAGPSMTRALSGLATFPFPNETIEKWQRGDYGNLTGIFDLTLSRLDASFFTGTRWECDLTWLEMQWGRTIGQFPSPCTAGHPQHTPGNPLVAPYRWDQGP
jgi:phospholipid/cholesterol/gamma-HCH transport system substrate-binding protein